MRPTEFNRGQADLPTGILLTADRGWKKKGTGWVLGKCFIYLSSLLRFHTLTATAARILTLSDRFNFNRGKKSTQPPTAAESRTRGGGVEI
jgi:hypothetical protein